MADHSKDKCAHPSCACSATQDSKFCSTYCEGASDTPDIMCSCGHAGLRSAEQWVQKGCEPEP